MGDAAEITKAVIGSELTTNLLGPSAEATGQNMSLRAREKRVSLWDREKKVIDAETARQKYFLEQQYKLKEVEKLLAKKLEHVAPEDIVDPEVYVAAPALQAISYSIDSEELRDMYAELLAKSMQKNFKADVHPSYVEIIKQLCPDEARLLRELYFLGDEEIPTISIYAKELMDKEEKNIFSLENDDIPDFKIKDLIVLLDNWTDAGEKANCEKAGPRDIVRYLDNLSRLGLIIRTDIATMVDDYVYEALLDHEVVKEYEDFAAVHPVKPNYTQIEIKKGFLRLTLLGKFFCHTCIS